MEYRNLVKEKGILAFTPGGSSMRPMLAHHNNPVVVKSIDQSKKPKKYDVIFYQRDDGQYVLHRIISEKDNFYTCCGDGQTNPEYGVRDDMIFAVLIGYYKGNRYIDVQKNISYKIYSRLWVVSLPIRKLYNKFISYFSSHIK